MQGSHDKHKKHKGSAGDISKCIGANLRALRQQARISQQEAASRLGISYQQMQKYESGANRLSAESVYVLKSFYNVPYEAFFRGIERAGATPAD